MQQINTNPNKTSFLLLLHLLYYYYLCHPHCKRALPPVTTEDFDPEEDEPILEPTWPHLQIVYELFLQFITSKEVNEKKAAKYVNRSFCLQFLELFDSEDPRERDYVKTITHRIYAKFVSHRSFLRRTISNVFYTFVYETKRHNGIGELLELLGSIIHGYAVPLKNEHLQFLVKALIPLHKPNCVRLYHQQLSYCILQYIEKEVDTVIPILRSGLFKFWPWSDSNKQILFLNELEEILELLGADQLKQVNDTLFGTVIARCLESDHCQVVERTLGLWNNEHLVTSGCLSRMTADVVLPILYGPLYQNGHWGSKWNGRNVPSVESLAWNVLKMYKDYDITLYQRCASQHLQQQQNEEERTINEKKRQTIQDRWSDIEAIAFAAAPKAIL